MSRLSRKVPVEPLTPDRVSRVERGVMAAFEGVDLAPPRRRSPWLRWSVPMVAAAGVALAIYMNVRASNGPLISPVAVYPDSRSSQVRTGADGGTEMTVGRAKVRLAPQSAARIDEKPDGGTLITLTDGKVRCVVEPRPDRPPFIVHAGDVKVIVVGTIFSVEMGETVRVEVERGKVRVERGEQVDMIAAGESWSDGRKLARVAAEPGTVGVGAPKVARGKTGDRVGLSKRRAKAPTVASRSRARAKTSPKKKTPEPDERIDPRIGLRRVRSLARPLVVEAKTPRDQIAAYRKLMSSGPQAEHAWYSVAYVQLKRLGQRGTAARTTRLYQRRFPTGKHARDVAWLRMQAMCGGGPSAGCRSAAHAYRGRYSGNARELEVVQSLIDWVR